MKRSRQQHEKEKEKLNEFQPTEERRACLNPRCSPSLPPLLLLPLPFLIHVSSSFSFSLFLRKFIRREDPFWGEASHCAREKEKREKKREPERGLLAGCYGHPERKSTRARALGERKKMACLVEERFKKKRESAFLKREEIW